MDEKQKVIEKIKKCLNLNKGTNFEGEAERAMAAAMKLAAGIGMTIDEIRLDDEEQTSKVSQNHVGEKRSKIPRWESSLGAGIADALGCVLVVNTDYDRKTFKWYESFILIGTPGDAVLFEWLYPYIIKQLRKLCHRDWNLFITGREVLLEANPGYRKSWERSWYKGAAYRVAESAEQKFKEQSTVEEQQQYALVVQDKKSKAEAFMQEQMHVTQMRSHANTKTDRSALGMGYQSGAEVSLNRPVETRPTALIGG